MKNFHQDICEKYARNSTSGSFKEHCEIQLVRFYIENPNTVPVMPYLGISKLSCFLCSEFLKYLQDPTMDGPSVEFCVRGRHGKVYDRWMPPENFIATEVMQDRVGKGLQRVVVDIKTRLRQRLELYRAHLLPGCDSPGWSSDENWD